MKNLERIHDKIGLFHVQHLNLLPVKPLYRSIVLILVLIICWFPYSYGTRDNLTLGKSSLSATSVNNFEEYVQGLYSSMHLAQYKLEYAVFEKAIIGYLNVKSDGNNLNQVLAIVDFNKPSTDKRLWVMDLKNGKVLFNSLVAHGKNSGENNAMHFSNQAESNKSSLGFYLAKETYCGKHGLSLKLRGMEKEYNSNAEARSIVMHGADYVCDDFVKKNGRLGRSQGCPAVPTELNGKIIDTLKGGGVLFMHHSSYKNSSGLMNKSSAMNVIAKK